MELRIMNEEQTNISNSDESDTEVIDLDKVRIEENNGKRKHSHSRRSRKHRHHRKKITVKQIVLSLLLVLLLMIVLGIAGSLYIYKSGEQAMKSENIAELELDSETDQTVQEQVQENVWKESMINILLIGVDSKGKEDEEVKQGTGNGQSDMLLLVSIDTKDETLTVIPINRDTMTTVTIKDQAGNLRGQEVEQIALSYSYGEDNADGSLLTAQAVSNLMHGLKIHAYFTVNISAIPIVNDAVGGVTVTLPEDFVNEWGDSYVKGSKVTLHGSMAEDYVRARSSKKDATNVARMARQKEYLIALARKALSEVKTNPKLAISVFQMLQPYMTTNIRLNEFSYLVSAILKCDFSEDCIQSIEGRTDDSGKYMEFYVDEEKLSDLIRKIYYIEVTQ